MCGRYSRDSVLVEGGESVSFKYIGVGLSPGFFQVLSLIKFCEAPYSKSLSISHFKTKQILLRSSGRIHW